MKLAKYKGIVNFILIVGILLCCLYTLHDVQTAEGVGLFFTLKLGMENRLPMDLLVDVLGIAVLAILVYWPGRFLKHGSSGACLRLLVGYSAVVPVLSLSKVIALFQREQRVFLWNMGFGTGLEVWVYSLLPFLQIWIPLLILLYGLIKINFGYCFSKWQKNAFVLQGVLAVVLFLIPSAENLLVYLIGYIGLVIAFDCWEVLYEKMPRLKKWYFPLFALLLLKGVFRMIVLVSQV